MNKKDYIALTYRAFSKLFDSEAYLSPSYFYLLLLLPLLVFWVVLKFKKDQSVVQVSNSGFFNHLKPSFLDRITWLPQVFNLLAFVFLVVALARPQDSLSWEEEEAQGIDLVVAMDLSSSMLAQDFKPNRLAASKEIAKEFVQGRVNDRFGLVVFAGESFTQCPLTIDHDRLVQLFDDLDIGLLEDGTAIGSGLATAVKRLKDSKAESKVIVLLTDGVNNTGEMAPETAANLATRFGIRVYTIGVGTEGNAKMPVGRGFDGQIVYQMVPVEIDENLLKSIADKSGGRYFRATSNEHLREIYKEIDELEKTEIASLKYSSKTELFLPFSLLAFSLLVIGKLLDLTLFKKLLYS